MKKLYFILIGGTLLLNSCIVSKRPNIEYFKENKTELSNSKANTMSVNVPLFLIKNNGKTTVYTQSATCTAFSNDLQRKNADLLRQTVKINGHDRYFGIVCYKNEVRFFVPPDIELKGKTL